MPTTRPEACEAATLPGAGRRIVRQHAFKTGDSALGSLPEYVRPPAFEFHNVESPVLQHPVLNMRQTHLLRIKNRQRNYFLVDLGHPRAMQ